MSKSEKEGGQKSKKLYKKPELEKMNDRSKTTVKGQPAPPVPGAPASAQASPIAPGATVF